MVPGKAQAVQNQQNQDSSPFDFLRNSGGYPSQKQLYEQSQQKHAQETESSDVKMARDQVRDQLRKGLLEDQFIEIQVEEAPRSNELDMSNEGMSIAIGNIFGDMMPKKKKTRKVKVKDARKILREQEASKLLDMDAVTDDAVENAEQNGIIFIDEIDKIAAGNNYGSGADVSREGVQRDILPIVEGSVVNTKYGPVKTDHILFIGAGAFSVSKPTDLIPELQGRFPIRVELQNLTKDDLMKILTVPKNAIVKQHQALLATEGIHLEFTDDAIEEIAEIAALMNQQNENIGARRLSTILERLLEDISYEIPEEGPEGKTVIDKDFVKSKFADTIEKDDVQKYIL
jgi:ATP-dependent HslUV protease ATP-binding subunit HslU